MPFGEPTVRCCCCCWGVGRESTSEADETSRVSEGTPGRGESVRCGPSGWHRGPVDRGPSIRGSPPLHINGEDPAASCCCSESSTKSALAASSNNLPTPPLTSAEIGQKLLPPVLLLLLLLLSFETSAGMA